MTRVAKCDRMHVSIALLQVINWAKALVRARSPEARAHALVMLTRAVTTLGQQEARDRASGG